MMKPETREEKIARLSSRRYTKAQLARLVTDGDGALARAERTIDQLRAQVPDQGVVVRAEGGRFHVTVKDDKGGWVVVTTPHRVTARAITTRALDEGQSPALAALTAIAEVGDTSATYRLPDYCAGLDLTGPWAKEDRRDMAKRRYAFTEALVRLESATHEEYPSAWANAVISARRADLMAPRLQPRHALRKVGAENDDS